MAVIFSIFIICILSVQTLNAQKRIMSEAFLSTPELITKNGYPVEIHSVETEDGYILEMHRIPKEGGIPVYLQHGLMDSSAGWVIMGKTISLGYYLSDLGYDVWLGNIRGNHYSKKHKFLKVDSKEYWDFSFQEIGNFDVPAMIDYILAKTQFSKLHYVGHSQGTTTFFVMCALREGYCDKIISMHALAPIAFLKHVKSPMIVALAPFVNQLDWLSKISGTYEYLPKNDMLTMSGQLICKNEAFTQSICSNAIFLVTGFNSDQLNKTMIPVILGHVPAGSSTKQFLHFGQLVNSGKFCKYDYGMIQNYLKYNSINPPSYDLSKVNAPVILLYGPNDWLADVRDVKNLESHLPNVYQSYLIEHPKFNHLDFILAIDSRKLVYDRIIKNMKKIETVTKGF